MRQKFVTGGRTDRRMDDRQQVIRELTWTFDSGDLKTSIFALKPMHLFYTLFKKKQRMQIQNVESIF